MAPAEWYRAYLSNPNEVEIEALESFEKQTCRNRCVIESKVESPKSIVLSVPVKKVEHKQLTRDIEISYQSHWQHQHRISLTSVYRHTPYFDYYADYILPFYEREYRFLWDLNSELHETIMALLGNHRPTESRGEHAYRATEDWRGDAGLNRFFGNEKSILDYLFEYGPMTSKWIMDNRE